MGRKKRPVEWLIRNGRFFTATLQYTKHTPVPPVSNQQRLRLFLFSLKSFHIGDITLIFQLSRWQNMSATYTKDNYRPQEKTQKQKQQLQNKIQTHKGSKERYLLGHKKKPKKFRGSPLCQATKRHLTVKRWETMINEMESNHSWFSPPHPPHTHTNSIHVFAVA